MRILPVAAACQFLFALCLAWSLVLMNDFKVKALLGLVKNHRDFVRAHLDYLLMSLFLMAFHLLYRAWNFDCGPLTAALLVFGTSTNPLGFLIPALYPPADAQPRYHPYKILLYCAFTSTTLGFTRVALDIFAQWMQP